MKCCPTKRIPRSTTSEEELWPRTEPSHLWKRRFGPSILSNPSKGPQRISNSPLDRTISNTRTNQEQHIPIGAARHKITNLGAYHPHEEAFPYAFPPTSLTRTLDRTTIMEASPSLPPAADLRQSNLAGITDDLMLQSNTVKSTPHTFSLEGGGVE